MIRAAAILVFASALAGRDTADQIMSKVAANQDRAQQLRSLYRFHQNVLVRVQRANGKPAREEVRDYRVTPTPQGMHRELLQLSGKVMVGRRTIPFDKPEFRYRGMDVDGEVVSAMIADLGGTQRENRSGADASGQVHVQVNQDETKTRDGIDKEMFPLSSSAQKNYVFTLDGEENYRGRTVYRILFTPRPHSEEAWAGEALIDREACQPVLITTHLALEIPLAVKVLLGTNIQHLGFKVAYQKFDDDVWFPVSYGGEMRLRVLFFYARRVSLGLVNSEFEKAEVRTRVEFEQVGAK